MNDNSSTPRLSRRALVRSGLVGAGLVALAGTGIAVRGTKLRALPRARLHVLSHEEYSILAAFADRVCPPKGDGFPSASEIDVARLADEALAPADKDAQDGLKLGLRIVENGLSGALFGERITPFTQLSPEGQNRALLGFRDSRLAIRRGIYRGIMGLCCGMYFGQSETWPAVGYGGPPNPAALRVAYADQLVDFDALLARPNGGAR